MRVLFEITHPKHAHLFRNAITELKKQNHTVAITAREKDVTTQLLESWENQIGGFTVLSRQSKSGIFRLAGELLLRNYRLFKYCRRFKPDVIVARVGPSAAQIGFFMKIPVIVFEDTDDASLQQWISFPFATRVCTAEHYHKNWGRKHIRYNSFDELAYLHPNRFVPDKNIVESTGLVPGEYIVVRFVSWQASHDINQRGIFGNDRKRVIERLQKLGRVVISSENPLPSDLKHLKIPGESHIFHHVLAFARLTFGESSTVCTEGAMLGVPGILINTMKWSSINRLQNTYGLVRQTDEAGEALDIAEQWLTDQNAIETFKKQGNKLIKECVDLTAWMVENIENISGHSEKHLP